MRQETIEAYLTGGLCHEERQQDDTWKVYSEVVYVMNLESRRYIFNNRVPEILIFSHPVNDPHKPASWVAVFAYSGKMTVGTYGSIKSAKNGIYRILKRYKSPFKNSKRKNSWWRTSQVSEKGKRTDTLIEEARWRIDLLNSTIMMRAGELIY